MPIVETTLIKGYAPEVKQRLAKALTSGILSVVNASLDSVVVVLREVEPENWMRGGVSRSPGPPIPAAVDIVQAYLSAHDTGDNAALAVLRAKDCAPAALPAGLAVEDVAEALLDRGSLVFVQARTGEGVGVLVRFLVVLGQIAAITFWRAPPD